MKTKFNSGRWRLISHSDVRLKLIWLSKSRNAVTFWLTNEDLGSLIDASIILRTDIRAGYGYGGPWLLISAPSPDYSHEPWACTIRYHDAEINLPQEDFDAFLKLIDQIVTDNGKSTLTALEEGRHA